MVHSYTKKAKSRVCQSQVCYLLTTHSSALKGGAEGRCPPLPSSSYTTVYTNLFQVWLTEERGTGHLFVFLLIFFQKIWKLNIHGHIWNKDEKCIQMSTEVLLQSKGQVTFWVKWVFGIIVRSTLLALMWYQNQVHNPPTFWDMIICV